MAVNGAAIISNTPQEEKSARMVADRVGFIRKTHYGEEFEVKAKDDTANVAYLSNNLQMHTDLPYYAYVPGVNLLHCLVQSKSKGAQNLLADGFYVAELMRKEHPQDYYLLSTVVINWSDIGEEKETSNIPFHSIYRAPMFCFDYDNNLERINHSIPQRDSFFSVNVKVVRDWYKALRKFVNLIHAEAVEFKTKEGKSWNSAVLIIYFV
jgi:gamma-butyrobetaine dioxygenase